MNSKKLVLLDFDGTITTKDTFPLFIKYDKGLLKFIFIFSLFAPLIVAFKLKLIKAEVVKRSILSALYKGTHKDVLFKKGENFIKFLIINNIIKTEFIKCINDNKFSNASICIVSASPDLWIAHFANKFGIDYLCTNLEYNSQHNFTGKFSTKNCNGNEKSNRIKENYLLADYKEIIAYGNSKDDEAMFKLASQFHLIK